MFKATKDIAIGNTIVYAGEEVQNPTQRMKDLGLVVEVQETVETVVQTAQVTEKPKKEKTVKETKEVKDETEKTEQTEGADETEEKLLTEQSSDVAVEKTDE